MEERTVKHKKIVVAAGLYPPDIGGPATYARMIETGLPNHHIDIIIVPFGKVRHLPKIIRHIAYMRLLYRASKTCDALYALDSVSVGVATYAVSLIRRKKFFIRLGGDYAWEQGRQRFGVTQTLDVYTENRSKSGFRTRLLA